MIEKLEKYLFVGIFVFSLLVFIAHTAYTKTGIFADARFYYSITHSLVVDFDIDFKNEYKFFGIEMETNKYGIPVNFYPPGVSILWFPSFWIADGFTHLVKIIFFTIDASGFGLIYQSAISLTNIFLGVFGLYLIYLQLGSLFHKRIAALTTLSLFSTTNLLFYIAVEPINSHAASFFISSFFTFLLIKSGSPLLLGFLAGFAGTIRTQDLAFVTLPAIQILLRPKKLVTRYLLLITGIFIGFLPQLALWRIFYDTFWKSPYLNYGFYFLKPQIIHVLFNTQNGLFTITPSILFALIGLLVFRKRSPKIFWYSIFYFLIQLYIISSWSGFAQGGSFGIRMVVTTYPLLSFGLAEIIKKIYQKFGFATILLLILFFSALNSALIIRYLLSF